MFGPAHRAVGGKRLPARMDPDKPITLIPAQYAVVCNCMSLHLGGSWNEALDAYLHHLDVESMIAV